MTRSAVPDVLDLLGVRSATTTTLKDVRFENASWLIETTGREAFVLRRYHDRATVEDLAYEHAVLNHLADTGWLVPNPVGEMVCHEGSWYCPTRYVPGRATREESPAQRGQRGETLARVHLALRVLGPRLGQRARWQAQHEGVTAHSDIDWDACLRAFAAIDSRLATWADRAATRTRATLSTIGADHLPVTVVHGDFAEWNLHRDDGRVVGIVDFGLTHLDSRPYELAIARTYRSPETVVAYRAELARNGWTLTDLEEAAIEPLHHAFRVDMTAWQIDHGRRTGSYDLVMIERQLARTGTPPP